VYFGDTEGGQLDIFRSSPEGGRYGIAENLGDAVNDPDSEDWGPYVDPDEDFLLFSSNRPGGFGKHDIYVCFRNPDGSWTQPQNLGASVNSPEEDFAPLITPDGKYLFFISQKAGDAGMNAYWVRARIIEDLRSGR
jgi:Tol biopolymer transport system component